MKIQRILCPIDFSDCSKKALEYAQLFAQGQNEEVILFHVVEPYVLPIEYGIAPVPYVELESKVKENAERELEAIAKEYFPKSKVQRRVVMGRASEVVLNEAREKKVDLIVMGTHGRTGLSHLFMGSTAERVVRLAPCAVLTVRGG